MKKQNKFNNQCYIYDEREEELMKNYIKQIVEKEYRRLLFRCLKFFNGKKFKSIDIEPNDVISNVIELILNAKRKINLTSYKTFRNSFHFILKNYLIDFCNVNKNKYNSLKVSFSSEEDEDYEYMGEFSGDINISDDYERKEIIEKIREILKPYKEEFEVFELMSKGYERDEIAKKLNVSSSDVTNIRKRIVRKLKSIPKSMVS